MNPEWVQGVALLVTIWPQYTQIIGVLSMLSWR